MTFRKFVRIHLLSRGKRFIARREIKNYMRQTNSPKLNIGCGKNILPGWLNADLHPIFEAVWMNAAEMSRHNDNIYTACLCEHMIEHVPKPSGRRFVEEIFRVLRPGGLLRVVTPDLSAMSRIVLEPEARESAEYLAAIQNPETSDLSACDAVNDIFYSHGHRYIYTIVEMSALLEEAGFTDLQVMRGGRYIHRVFDGVDGHPKVSGARKNEIQAFAIEAQKSAS